MGHARTGTVMLAGLLFMFSLAEVLHAAETTGAPGDEMSDIPLDQPTQTNARQSPTAPPGPMPQPLTMPSREPKVGPVTGLPLPRFVSMKSNLANVRRGPSTTHRIDWQFTRKGLPVQVVAEYGHWRLVRDQDGMGGWVHYALLSGRRTVMVQTEMLELHDHDTADSRVVAKLEQGVIAELGACTKDWCDLTVSGYSGWAPKTALWGVEPDEVHD